MAASIIHLRVAAFSTVLCTDLLHWRLPSEKKQAGAVKCIAPAC